ncbi:MAG: DUF4173 domain-containing protein [Gemmatimonadaceae bacterium]|nr:DUF4173 domain-containing protein [Gemmatimonadaceae bacterium]
MPTTSRNVLVAALLLGLAGDYLLRGAEWRLGFSAFLALAVGTALAIGGAVGRDRLLLLAGLCAAGLGLGVRDAEWVTVVDVLSVLCTGALLVWLGSGKRLAELTVVQAIRAAVLAPLSLAAGAAVVLAGASPAPDEAQAEQRAARVRAAVVGAVFAAPILLLIGGLLSSSDVVFSRFLEAVAAFLGDRALQHAVVVAAVAWVSAGWLRATVAGGPPVRLPEEGNPGLPFLSVGVSLYGLLALLTLFLGVQARALYGGSDYLLRTAGLTVAEYARQGFFQLVVASALVLGTLIAAEWALASDDAEGRRRYRAVGTVLVALVAALLVSAAARMGLYVQAFGLSVDRVTATSVMVWTLAALATFGLTTLRGQAARFAPAMLAVTVAWVVALNALNLEAMIVRVNAGRAARGALVDASARPGVHATSPRFDAEYHAALSADALPALLEAAPTLPAADCHRLAERLAGRWRLALVPVQDGLPGYDWRASGLARERALAWARAGAQVTCAPAAVNLPG